MKPNLFDLFKMSSFSLALIQLSVKKDRLINLTNAKEKISEAANHGAKVICLPECFNSPYGIQHFSDYAEEIPNGITSVILSKAAKAHQVYLIGGSIPEVENGKIFNTCTVWNPQGELIGKYQKIHLNDIDIPGKITFKESEVLSAGNEYLSFATPWTKIGIGICYDLRFPDLAQVYARHFNCGLLVFPGAFHITTGISYILTVLEI